MNRGGGRRVVKVLDSPHTSKGCIMRSSPWSPHPPSRVTLHSLLTTGAANVSVRQNVFASVVSHSRGYFGLQYVEFRWCIFWLQHKPCSYDDAFDVFGLMCQVHLLLLGKRNGS